MEENNMKGQLRGWLTPERRMERKIAKKRKLQQEMKEHDWRNQSDIIEKRIVTETEIHAMQKRDNILRNKLNSQDPRFDILWKRYNIKREEKYVRTKQLPSVHQGQRSSKMGVSDKGNNKSNQRPDDRGKIQARRKTSRKVKKNAGRKKRVPLSERRIPVPVYKHRRGPKK